MLPALEWQSLNHWITRKVPWYNTLIYILHIQNSDFPKDVLCNLFDPGFHWRGYVTFSLLVSLEFCNLEQFPSKPPQPKSFIFLMFFPYIFLSISEKPWPTVLENAFQFRFVSLFSHNMSQTFLPENNILLSASYQEAHGIDLFHFGGCWFWSLN